MRKRGKLQLAEETVNRWRRRGTLDNTNYDFNELIKFVDTVYLKLKTRKEKQATGFYIRLNKPLSEFSIDNAIEADREFRQGTMADGTRKHIACIPNKKEYYLKREKVSKNTRIKNYGSVRLSYIQGLISKGKIVAERLNINEQLSDKEYIKLSGYDKHNNFKKLSDNDKQEYVLKYKLTHLHNKKIRNYIERHYPEFKKIDVNTLSADNIHFWYQSYMSVRSAEGMNIRSKRGISGFFYSSKNENRIYYRSSYELRFCEILENDVDVVFFETEPYHIKYKNSNGENHCYVPDFRVIYKNGDLQLFEVKPNWRKEEFIEKTHKYLTEDVIIITEDDLWKD